MVQLNYFKEPKKARVGTKACEPLQPFMIGSDFVAPIKFAHPCSKLITFLDFGTDLTFCIYANHDSVPRFLCNLSQVFNFFLGGVCHVSSTSQWTCACIALFSCRIFIYFSAIDDVLV